MALLSVITPVYNGAAFVRRCYQMLRLQSFQEWEWVVVNDGSRDGTVGLIEEIQRRDSRVRLIDCAQRHGRGYARTKALGAARGDWVVVWDVDDLYFPERLERIDRARGLGFDFYVSRTITTDPKLNHAVVHGFTEPFEGLAYRVGYHTAMAMKTEVARKVGYLPGLRSVGQIGEDVGMVYELPATRRGYFDEQPMAVYVVGHEVFLRKSLDVNRVRVGYWRMMLARGLLPLGAGAFRKLERADGWKMLALGALRVLPWVYPALMWVRKFGLAPAGLRALTGAEAAFIEGMRERLGVSTEAREAVPAVPELAYAG